MTAPPDSIGRALAAIDRLQSGAVPSLFNSGISDAPVDRMPDMSEAEMTRRGTTARAVLAEFDALDLTALPESIVRIVDIARYQAGILARADSAYWLLIDPMGLGFFGMFAPTAYCGGMMLGEAHRILARHRFAERADLHRYLGLIADYARLVDQVRLRSEGQAARGIHIPRPQLEQASALMQRLRAAAPAAVQVDAARLATIDDTGFAAQVAHELQQVLLPAYDRLLAWLAAPETRASAPETVGLAQYPGGPQAYADLVKLHTTQDLTPEQVHAQGHAIMAEIEAEMLVLAGAAGHATPQAWLAALEGDPTWRDSDPDAIAARFQHCIDRLAPHIPQQFRAIPKAPYGAAALPAELSASMTFGYFSAPTPASPKGLYYFNAENLARNPLVNVAALNYHELVPGHHFHVALQRENQALHPLQRLSFVNAYNEGWAEYAASLAGELGMYAAPEDRFGRLIMEAFLCCRLVTDTGMNALGWSLEQARDYMRRYSFMPEAEIQSESIRYSCDIPGQGLAYKLGDRFLMKLRARMQERLGRHFDIRDFHDTVLRYGCLPLPAVAAAVDAETERLLEAAA